LKERFKDLTASEVRLAALTKLNVPTKEMAFMLNVNKETIHTSRYRLRKKLGYIESDIDLSDLLADI
jgi:DNA-binding CsgD family transcriptional regulator